jgi:hypothetical protein
MKRAFLGLGAPYTPTSPARLACDMPAPDHAEYISQPGHCSVYCSLEEPITCRHGGCEAYDTVAAIILEERVATRARDCL